MRNRLRIAVASLSLIVTIGACGGGDDDEAEVAAATSTTSVSTTAAPTTVVPTTVAPVTTAPVVAAPACRAKMLFAETFEQEQVPPGDGVSRNHASFANWTVTGGAVDMVDSTNKYVPVPSKVVDLDGSSQTRPGAITTKMQFAVPPAGCVAVAEVRAAGNGRVAASDTFEVRYAGQVLGTLTLARNDPYAVRSFRLPAVAGTLTIAQTNPPDNAGILVDGVEVKQRAA